MLPAARRRCQIASPFPEGCHLGRYRRKRRTQHVRQRECLECQRGSSKAHASVGVAEGDEILAEPLHADGRAIGRGQLQGEEDGQPEAPEEVADGVQGAVRVRSSVSPGFQRGGR
jgi:hypothetical protein